MVKKATKAAEAVNDAALKESFAEIEKAAQTKTEKKPADKKTVKKAPAKAPAKEEAAAKAPEAKAEKKPEKKAAPAKKSQEVATKVTFQFNGKEVVGREVADAALQDYLKKVPGASVETLEVYVVADQNAAYYVVNGTGSSEYRIDL